MINLFQQRLESTSAYEIATYVVKTTGIIQDLKKAKTIEAQNRIENVTELLDGIKSFVEEDEIDEFSINIEDRSILSYLQNVVLITDLDKDQDDLKCVKLMS